MSRGEVERKFTFFTPGFAEEVFFFSAAGAVLDLEVAFVLVVVAFVVAGFAVADFDAVVGAFAVFGLVVVAVALLVAGLVAGAFLGVVVFAFVAVVACSRVKTHKGRV